MLTSPFCAKSILPKSLLDTDLNNLSEAGLKVINGFNMNEVQISPKKLAKVGFFERLFHFFS